MKTVLIKTQWYLVQELFTRQQQLLSPIGQECLVGVVFSIFSLVSQHALRSYLLPAAEEERNHAAELRNVRCSCTEMIQAQAETCNREDAEHGSAF